MRREFVPKREEVAGGWRRLHNEFRILHASPNIVSVIKSRNVKLSWHVERMGDEKYIQNLGWKT
jgi:hypothetical protein